ncbi:type III polyketide synthase [Sphingomonas changnyeongensis]|uniref:type III polyketide synthase n=1 Tax=Sphingomonas changnyeongensis TaxID=2698679 RepID=UPI001E56E6E9|nr:type III polyketide synthase [Sphingomonas changnyeongensis]
MPDVYLNAIGTATPGHDIHRAFVGWASARIPDPRERRLFDRMAARAGIDHRFSVLPIGPDGASPVAPGGFYADPVLPGTAARMAVYADAAPALALRAIAALGPAVSADPGAITHIVVASCTGFTAPGIDQIIARALGLAPTVERLLIGFMGCYAAVTALRSARHIVRSVPGARVLVVTVELSSLHLQDTPALEPLLAMLQFGDGAAAALVSGEARGLRIDAPFAATLPDSADLIRWDIGDQGFAMHLSGEVPGRIARALAAADLRALLLGEGPDGKGADRDGPDVIEAVPPVDGWAVHAGGRSILDAVEAALGLPDDALDASRAVLRSHGNMSSATLMFVLARMIGQPIANGVALAFGPGLAAEGFRFRAA